MMDSIATKKDAHVVVFTDLDGTLLEHETYGFSAANEALDFLQGHNIPVVLCSSKTRAEIELIQLDLGLRHPFISENGGAIFFPRSYFSFAPEDMKSVEGYDVIEFGAPYWKLVETIHQTARELGATIIGFSDMSVEEIARSCQFAAAEARLAKLRDYDEPFRFIDSSPALKNKFFTALHDAGFRCTQGGRFYHATGVTDKGQAIKRLASLYRRAWGNVVTVGLGDSLNDLPLLQEVDIPIIVRNPAVGAATELLRKVPTAVLTTAPGPRGWNEKILEVVGRRVIQMES